MNLFKKATASIALVALVSGIFSAGVSANSASEIEAANMLAAKGYIVNHSSDTDSYNLNQNVLRQEIAAVARGVAGLDKKTTCDDSFADVSETTPNTWACYTVEALLDAELIAANENFRPEENISKAEAIGMMVKAAFGSEYSFDSSLETSWQEQVVEFAVSKGVVSSFTNYDTAATRGFVFEAGANSVVATEEEAAVEECDEISALLGLCGDDEVVDETPTDETPTDETPTVEGGNVEVTLSPLSPASATIPGLSTLTTTKVDVTAGDSDVAVNSVDLKLMGLGAASAVGSVALFTDSERISRDRTFSSTTDDVSVNLTNPLVVKAGSTETINVIVKTTTAIGASSNQGSEFAVAIESINASAEVQGTMPVVGSTFKIGSVNAIGATISQDATLSNVNLGEKNVSVASFKVKNDDSNTDVRLSQITLRDNENKMRSNLANLALYNGSTKIAEVASVNDRYVTFSFDELTIASNQTARFTVKADIIGGAGDSIVLFLDKTLDIVGKDSKYNFGLDVTNNYDGTTDAKKSSVSILAGDLTIVGMDATTTDLAADKKDLLLGKFKIVSNAGENLELEKVTVEIERTAGSANLNTTIDKDRVRLVNETNGSSYELDHNVLSTATNMVLDYDPYISLGAETVFAVYADTLTTAANGEKFRVKLDTSDTSKFKIVETSDDTTVSNITPSTLTLKALEIKSNSAEIFRNTMLSTQNVVIDSKNVEVLSFDVEAGTMSDVNFDLVEVKGSTTAVKQTSTVTVADTATADVYSVKVNGTSYSVTDTLGNTYNSDNDVAVALAAAIDANTAVDASAVGAVITVESATAGDAFTIVDNSSTVAPTIATTTVAAGKNVDNSLFTQARLYRGSVSDANLIASKSASQFSNDIIRFDGFTSEVVKQDETQRYIVTVDFANDDNLSEVKAAFKLEDINLKDSDNDDITPTGLAGYTNQTLFTVKGSGNFSTDFLTTNSNNQYNKTVLAGNKLTVATYELNGINEDVKIEDVIITLAANAAAVSEVSTLTFDADLVTSNTVDLKVNGVAITQVPFNTDHDTTMADLATEIQSHADVLSAAVTGGAGSRVITITAATAGEAMTISDVEVALGASQADATVATTTYGKKALSRVDAKSAIESVELHLNGTLVGTTPNSKINSGNGTITFERLNDLIVPSDSNNELTVVINTNTVGHNKLGAIVSGQYFDSIRFEKAEGVDSGKVVEYAAADHEEGVNSKTFTISAATVLASVDTTFNNSATAEFKLNVQTGDNNKADTVGKPVVNVNELRFTKSGNKSASGYTLKDEDDNVLAVGVASGTNGVIFSNISVAITDVETLKIEADTTQVGGADATYGLTLARDGIIYNVNGVYNLINNSTSTISFGSKN